MKTSWSVIGVMSGTSLDGLDIALCNFRNDSGKWQYEIVDAECYNYDKAWKQKLNDAYKLSGLDLLILHKEYGFFIGDRINSFLKKDHQKPDLIATHGHTVFHQPDKKLSFQLGGSAALFASTGIPVVSDFRALDVCLGGQGAPLVPVGDAILFKEYDYCLNLGGIANISYDKDNQRIAFDICGCNLLLNTVANEIGLDYDNNGQIARTGKVDQDILNQLNSWQYYAVHPPKSLDKETLLSELLPLINSLTNIRSEDKLATISEHIATQIVSSVEKRDGSMLVTGGGAFNRNLIDKIREKTAINIIVPSAVLVEYKEALVFAFLGLLRTLNQTNTLASVTGANTDSIGGALFGEL